MLCLHYKYKLGNPDKKDIHTLPTLKITESHGDTLQQESEFQCKRKYVYIIQNCKLQGWTKQSC
jgi:hypothetical protein